MDMLVLDRLLEIAPTASIAIVIVGIGYAAGYKAREGQIKDLKEMIKYLQGKL